MVCQDAHEKVAVSQDALYDARRRRFERSERFVGRRKERQLILAAKGTGQTGGVNGREKGCVVSFSGEYVNQVTQYADAFRTLLVCRAVIVSSTVGGVPPAPAIPPAPASPASPPMPPAPAAPAAPPMPRAQPGRTAHAAFASGTCEAA